MPWNDCAQEQFVVIDNTMLAPQILERRLGWWVGEDLGVAGRTADTVEDLRLNRRHRLAIMANRVFDHLVGNDRVPLAGDDIQDRLGADQLGERRHHSGIAEFLADYGGL